MSCLHILNKSADQPRFAQCMVDLAPGDTVILTENAVLAIVDARISFPDGVTLKALAPDLEARGLDPKTTEKAFDAIDFPTFVNLTLHSEKVVCW